MAEGPGNNDAFVAGAGGKSALGRAAAWSRDMAIVGATTSFLAGYGLERHLRAGMVVAAGVGGVVGSLFGIAFRRILLARLHLPIVTWIPISLVLGAVFGGTIGLVTPLVMGDVESMGILAFFGACAGALQLSWFWLPYALRAGRGKSTWPVVVAAVVVATVIGYAALWTMLAIWRPRVD
jgi:hypothetical protein